MGIMEKIPSVFKNILEGPVFARREFTDPEPPGPPVVNESFVAQRPKTPMARYTTDSYVTYTPIFSVSYTGEKNLGEAGPARDYWMDYDTLRVRSWQSYIENEVIHTIVNKLLIWSIGSGLKLQARPNKTVLATEGINIVPEQFNEVVEARFGVYASSRMSDFSNMRSLHRQSKRAKKQAILGGDVLAILRLVDDNVKVQLVDGANVRQPWTIMHGAKLTNGNTVKCGVELSPEGEHVAYYVRKAGSLETERIPAKTESGLRVAFLVYGSEYRVDEVRGMPLVAVLIETAKKMERYKEATVASAEERAKIAYFFEHGPLSTEENPLAKQMALAFNADAVTEDLPQDDYGNQLADKVAATTNKMTFNLPKDSKIATVDKGTELYFKDFYSVLRDTICAAFGIPPEVAMTMFNSNYSASRAAIMDWGHTLNVSRKDFSEQFSQPVFEFWLLIEIFKNKVQAPGYLQALAQGNMYITEAYHQARFVGPPVPHIDPLKEVQAERAKLGTTGLHIPLTTVEAATEALNGGDSDSDSNMEQYAEELKMAEGLGIKMAEPQQSESAGSGSEDDPD